MNYILGIFLQLLSNTIIGVANVFDGQLSRKTFSSVWVIVCLNGILLIPALPILFLILKPSFLLPSQLILVLVIASIEFSYQIPYYKALREAETSVVMSLFSLEKIFVPVFAYFIVAERLALVQYIGFGIIVALSLVITFDRKSFKWSKAISYMIPVTVILALSSVLQKYGLGEIKWNAFYFWSLALSLPFYIFTLFFIKSARSEVSLFFKKPFDKKYIPLYGQNIFTWVSGGIGTIALSILPVTISKAVSSFHALIVHIIASKGSKRLGIEHKEEISWRRILIFCGIAVGVFLTLFFR